MGSNLKTPNASLSRLIRHAMGSERLLRMWRENQKECGPRKADYHLLSLPHSEKAHGLCLLHAPSGRAKVVQVNENMGGTSEANIDIILIRYARLRVMMHIRDTMEMKIRLKKQSEILNIKEILNMYKLKKYSLMLIISVLMFVTVVASRADNLTATAIVRKCDLHYRSLKKLVLIEKCTNNSEPKEYTYWIILRPENYINIERISNSIFGATIYNHKMIYIYSIQRNLNQRYVYQLVKALKLPAKYELNYDPPLYANIEGMIKKYHYNVKRLKDDKVLNILCYVIKIEVYQKNVGTATYILYIDKSNCNILMRKNICKSEPESDKNFSITTKIYQHNMNNLKSADFNINYIIKNMKTIAAQL